MDKQTKRGRGKQKRGRRAKIGVRDKGKQEEREIDEQKRGGKAR